MMQISQSQRSATEFIDRVVQRKSISLQSAFQGLLGMTIGERAGVLRSSEGVDRAAARVARSVARESAAGRFNPYDYDAKLLLLCHLTLRRRGLSAPALAAFAHDLATAMRSLSEVPDRLYGEAGLLVAAGVEPFWDDSRWKTLALPSGELLRADTESLRAFCLQVASWSVFGLVPLELSDREPVQRGLPLVLLQKLREYDLLLAAMVMRTIKYLSLPADEELRYATEFLLCQQQPDGRFGYYARELAEGPALYSAEQQLYLPVTVSVLWALTEAWTPAFCLSLDRVDVESRLMSGATERSRGP